MARRILVIQGSPRSRGNTRAVTAWAVAAMRGAEAEVHEADATGLSITGNGCVGCMECQKSSDYVCVQHDDASALASSMARSQVIVLATPVYFFGPTAQLKAAIDRMYSLVKFHLAEGKVTNALTGRTLAAIVTAGGPPGAGLRQTVQHLRNVANFFGCRFDALEAANLQRDPALVQANVTLRTQAEMFGRRLAGEG